MQAKQGRGVAIGAAAVTAVMHFSQLFLANAIRNTGFVTLQHTTKVQYAAKSQACANQKACNKTITAIDLKQETYFHGCELLPQEERKPVPVTSCQRHTSRRAKVAKKVKIECLQVENRSAQIRSIY